MAVFGLHKHPTAQKINSIQKELTEKKSTFDKTENHFKILAGTYFLDLLEKNSFHGLRKHTVETMNDYLTRASDRELFKPMLEEFAKDLGINLPEPSKKEKPKEVTPQNPQSQIKE